MSTFRTVRGMRDFLPVDAEKLRYVEQVARELAVLYGYGEILTPVVESYELLSAKSGEEIRQRMYVFTDLGGRKVALRPEFTASVARLVATKLRNAPKPLRLFSVGSLYRYDEPQYGRFREFWQANYELMGSDQPEADAEILTITNHLLKRLGLSNYYFKIGHVGILRGILSQEGIIEDQQNHVMQMLDKKQWEEALATVRQLGASQQCLTTLKEIFETRGQATFSILKKTEKIVRNYERGGDAVRNLRQILTLATRGGKFETLIEPGFARGLEYYTGMIFEAYVPELETALGGGGRYDRLIELFEGEHTPAVGIAPGIDRIVLAMKKQKARFKTPEEKRAVVIPVNAEMKVDAFEIASMLREAMIPTDIEATGRTVSKALSDANRRSVTYAILVGPEELKERKIVLRNLKTRTQETLDVSELIEKLEATK
ncbi:MAG: histidine--tRNA ligase [Candidatus Bathyarchaeota archaeon]